MDILRAVKAINSQWTVGHSAMSMTKSGKIYETFYIKGAATLEDYKAVARYTGLIAFGYNLYRRLK